MSSGRPVDVGNILADASPPIEGERFEPLLELRDLVIERIVSSAAVSPTEYDQPQDEWVLLVRGEAELEVAGVSVTLATGDHVFLPAGTRHVVKRVSEGTVWLAVHLGRQF